MFACLDIHYRRPFAHAALRFEAWDAAQACDECEAFVPVKDTYVPGPFYRRKLGPLLAVAGMHGRHRILTLLKAVDALARRITG